MGRRTQREGGRERDRQTDRQREYITEQGLGRENAYKNLIGGGGGGGEGREEGRKNAHRHWGPGRCLEDRGRRHVGIGLGRMMRRNGENIIYRN